MKFKKKLKQNKTFPELTLMEGQMCRHEGVSTSGYEGMCLNNEEVLIINLAYNHLLVA